MNINTTNPTLFLLFNHCLTVPQETDARTSLGVDRIVLPPPEISRLWQEIPPESDELISYLAPIFSWLGNEAICLGLVPVYFTTRRQAVEQHLPDGQVKISHIFSHVRYWKYIFSVKSVAGCLAKYGNVKIDSLSEICKKVVEGCS